MRERYPYVIDVCCMLFLMVNLGFPNTSFSVYQPYLVAMDGVGNAGGSLVLSVRSLASMAAMLFVGRFYSLLDCRVGVTLSCAFTALGFVLYGVADTLPLLCVAAAASGLGYGLGGMVACTLLVGRWFKEHVGTATGFASLGSGIATMYVPVIVLWAVGNLSLSAAFFAEAAIALAVAAVSFALIRNKPEELGVQPLGGAREDAAEGAAAQDAGQGAESPAPRPARPAISGSARLLLYFAASGLGAACMGGGGYISVHISECGFDAVFSALMVTLFGGSLLVSKFLTGELFDHLGTMRASALMYAILIVGLAMLVVLPEGNAPLAVVGCVCSGAGLALGTVGIAVYSLELSDAAHRMKMVKNCQVSYALGGFIATAFSGPLAELAGAYTPAYVVFLFGIVCSCAIVLGAYRKYRPQG